MTQTVKTDETVERLRMLLAREGEAIAPALAAPGAEDVIGPLVCACAAGRRPETPAGRELALVLESILEGYLLHYGRSRLVDTADEDLRLLAGDHLYALGLSRLARLGDLEAVRALADLITLCARAHADAGANGGPAAAPAALWLLTRPGRGRRPMAGVRALARGGPRAVAREPTSSSRRPGGGPPSWASSFKRRPP